MNLIVGASGRAGSRVARRLLERGEPVRAVSRDPSRLADLEQLGAQVVRGDLLAPEWMGAALRGVRCVVLSSHGLVPPSRRNAPPRADDEGNRRIIDAAARAGVEHVVFVSAALASADSPALFGRLKHRVEEYLRASGLGHTLVRPTTFIETHAITLLAEPLLAKGKVAFMGRGETPMNWVSTDDVAAFIVDSVLAPATGRTVVLGGPDVMSRLDALAVVARVLGRTAKRSHVPLPLLRGVRSATGLLHPGLHYLLDAVVAEETVGDARWWSPTLDWTGPATVEAVVQGWAARGRASGAVPAGGAAE